MSNVIHDRGRGPEIIGTRVTIYHLMPYFLDSASTEQDIAKAHSLTVEQVSAARAYVLNNPEVVLSRHLDIERKIARGNPPEVIEQAARTHALFLSFKQWLADKQTNDESKAAVQPLTSSPPIPSFREWLTDQESKTPQGP